VYRLVYVQDFARNSEYQNMKPILIADIAEDSCINSQVQ
jgi:hypothetical protein